MTGNTEMQMRGHAAGVVHPPQLQQGVFFYYVESIMTDTPSRSFDEREGSHFPTVTHPNTTLPHHYNPAPPPKREQPQQVGVTQPISQVSKFHTANANTCDPRP